MKHTSNKELRVLSCDDNMIDTELLKRVINRKKLPWKLSSVASASCCLEYLLDPNSPGTDILLLDINMPGTNGIQLISKIKKHPKLHEIPIVMLTTSPHQTDINQSFEKGAAGYLVKPEKLKEFDNLVDTLDVYWRQTSRIPFTSKERENS